MAFENHNTKQVYFNEIRGVVTEINDGEEWCSVTLSCGHERLKNVNLVCKKVYFDKLKEGRTIGDKVVCRYHLASYFKHTRWFTSAILLSCDLD